MHTRTVPSTTPDSGAPLTVDDLGGIRRQLLALLRRCEPWTTGQAEGVRRRISRLSQVGGPIPRRVAALMYVVTEMRNSAEYEDTLLTSAESDAVLSAWAAIQEWFSVWSARAA